MATALPRSVFVIAKVPCSNFVDSAGEAETRLSAIKAKKRAVANNQMASAS
jgi:hypothetical protein